MSNGAVPLPGADERDPAQVAADFARWFKGLAATLAAAAEIAGQDAIADLIEQEKERLSAKQRMFIEHIAETRRAVQGVLAQR